MKDKDIMNLKSTPILEFYHGSSILLTGCTGFMGKVVLEKLLRSCPDIKMIYLLMRAKKGENVTNRMENLFNDQVFQILNEEQSKSIHKVMPVSGDISREDLGLCESDRCMLVREVTIVLHLAANVKFNEKMKSAIETNVVGTKGMLNLSKEMKNLQVFVHVSTAYSNCNRSKIDEKVYPPPVDPEGIVNCTHWMTEDQYEGLTPLILGEWPNTYTFSKAVAENLVKSSSETIPVVIFRPSIVLSTWKEPVAGWIDNMNGPAGITVGSLVGIIRTYHCDTDKVVDLVPVDMAANALIAAAWDTATRKSKTTVYNFVSSSQNPITWKEYVQHCEKYGYQCPSLRSVWYYSLVLCNYKRLHDLLTFLLHFLPACLMDGIALILGKKRRMLKLYQKIDMLILLTSYFATREWTYCDNNVRRLLERMSVEDQEIFDFDLKKMSWDLYMQKYIPGLRKYLLKEDPSTIPSALRRYKVMYVLHRGLQAGLLLLAYSFITRLAQSFS